jgi:hypothetical protein
MTGMVSVRDERRAGGMRPADAPLQLQETDVGGGGVSEITWSLGCEPHVPDRVNVG